MRAGCATVHRQVKSASCHLIKTKIKHHDQQMVPRICSVSGNVLKLDHWGQQVVRGAVKLMVLHFKRKNDGNSTTNEQVYLMGW